MKGKNLLDRFTGYKDFITKFATDERVPFTNNQAERDLRPNKIKMKIS
jgi:transposase